MARKPNGKKASLSVVGGTQTPGPGHNSGATVEQISDDQLHSLTLQHAKRRAVLVKAEKDAKAARMNLDKEIKSDLGVTGLADIKLLAELETPEGEAKLKAEMERQMRVARWAGLPVGTQTDMFSPDMRPIGERAFDEGKRDGMASTGPLNPPANYSPGTDGYNGYIEGWHKGQAVLAGGIKPMSSDSPLLRPSDNKPDGLDEFDEQANGAALKQESTGPAAGEPDGGQGSGDPWPDDAAVAEREPAEAL